MRPWAAGTGKTHTMEGLITDPDERGVIPRAAFDVFRRLADDSYVEHSVTASFLEIYNEELCDLLLDVNPDAIEAAKVRRCESKPVFKGPGFSAFECKIG